MWQHMYLLKSAWQRSAFHFYSISLDIWEITLGDFYLISQPCPTQNSQAHADRQTSCSPWEQAYSHSWGCHYWYWKRTWGFQRDCPFSIQNSAERGETQGSSCLFNTRPSALRAAGRTIPGVRAPNCPSSLSLLIIICLYQASPRVGIPGG